MGRRRWRKLIILRGPPGSRKTDKANELLNDFKERGIYGIIVSADDYFRNPNGEIVDIDPRELWEAHKEAREKAFDAMLRKANPIIIDNTNMEFQYMYPYVFMGFRRGYWIEFVDLMDEDVSPYDSYRRCKEKIPLEKFEKWKASYRKVKHIYQILYDPVSRCKWKNYRW
ncbi:NEDD4-binding protein 2-like 1 [Alosa pseudoharengus]|uniref:NEDD4-binding protein 2-like 1 n=1 Tax=Alosa pseudoharengus TaxID=34774 RepID=UPI003F8B8893